MTACFEVSYEICNKVGGIYTVIKSKTKAMKQSYEEYYAIGYYSPDKAKGEFEQEPLPEKLKSLKEFFHKQGINIYYGAWIKGNNVKTFLIECSKFEYNMINSIKKELWDKYQVDSMNSPSDFNAPVAWAWAAGMLIEKIVELLHNDKKVIIHSHEWLSGACNLYLKSKGFKKGLVFTSHATVLGRSYAGRNHKEPLVPKNADVNKLVYDYGVQAKHYIEKASANESNIFTTVSETTGKEAEIVLGVKPQVLTFNALDFSKMHSLGDLTNLQPKNRRKMNDFLKFYFLPYYNIDIENAFLVMTSGRNEFMGKGIDLFINSLVELNNHLRKTKSNKTVIGLIFVPSYCGERVDELRKNYNKFHFIEEQLEEKMDGLYKKLIDTVLYSRNVKELCNEDFVNELEILSRKFKKGKGNPPINAFNLINVDDIYKSIQKSGLDNKKKDNVKIIYYPCYVTPEDSLIEMDYFEIVNACDMAVFPSRYEPWGYTPIEAAANLTVSITSDLSGCGKYILKNFKNNKGIIVVDINDNTSKKIKNLIVENMSLNEKELLIRKIKAREISESLDWKVQIKNYIKAHKLSLK